jgi:hypothetical protein
MPMSDENEPLGSRASPTNRRIGCPLGVALGSVDTALGLGLVDEVAAAGVDTDGSGAETGAEHDPMRNDATSRSALGLSLIGEL